MSRKLSRNVKPGRKIHLEDDRPLPEAADELVPSNYHPFGEKVETFSLTDLERNLPRVPSAESQSSFKSAEDFSQQISSYYGHDSEDGSNIWDEYWFPCESESSDLSQSAASFMSWSDEIEVETTKKLQRFYDDIESFLYDEAPAPADVTAELLDECLVWKSRFPHIRVVGKAIRPPAGYRIPSSLRFAEEVIAADDSDDGTLQESPSASFVELSEPACRLFYDDVTLGTRREADGATLRGRLGEAVRDGIFAHVAAALGGSEGSRDRRGDGSERSRTSTDVAANVAVMPRVATSSSSSRLAVGPPINVSFDPTDTRAYHSAAIRAQSRPTPTRRLHSFAGNDLAPARLASRQDVILRELRESQLRLAGIGTGIGTGDGQEKPRSKTWSGGRHNALPPLEKRHRAQTQDKLTSSPRVPSRTIEVNGTATSRKEPNEITLKKYSPLGGSSTTLTAERPKLGRL